MNWYKKYIFAGLQSYDWLELMKKMKMFGFREVYTPPGDNKKSTGHVRFKNINTEGMLEFPAFTELPKGKTPNAVTVDWHIVKMFKIKKVWDALGKSFTKKQFKAMEHLLPWNQIAEEEKEEEKEEEPKLDQPWERLVKEQLEKEEEAKLKDEEETRLLEEMIKQDELVESKPALAMSNRGWHKKAQNMSTNKMPTMDDITWAIDKIIAEQYDFSVEELSQEGSGYGEMPVSKAAQVKRRRKNEKPHVSFPLPEGANSLEYDIMHLFERGWSAGQIGRQLGFETKIINGVLKKYFSSIDDREKYVENLNTDSVMDETQNQISGMKDDYNIMNIGPKDIADVLQINHKLVSHVLSSNNINLVKLKEERRDAIAADIKKIALDFNGEFKVKDIQEEFYERHNFKLKNRSAYSAVVLFSLGDKKQNDQASIFKAFTTYVWSMYQGGIGWFVLHPEQLSPSVDKFFNTYGQYHMKKSDLIEMAKVEMAKIQIRDRTLENIRDPQNPNRHAPLVFDDSHPSYFLNNQEQNQNSLQVASDKKNWYKKANKWKDKIPGGLADGKKPSQFNKRQVEKGKKVEYEHTSDPGTAREIAIDHLEEHPKYYQELEKMEDKLEKKKPARRGRFTGHADHGRI